MNKHTELKKEEWRGKIADQRTSDRSKYIAAPSSGLGILAKYEELLDKAIENKQNLKILVLGATPELRDMVLERGRHLTTLDISQDMLDKTKKCMKYSDHKNEKIILGDWLSSSLPDNHFDIILGDGVSNNIAFKDQDKFFVELKRLLKLDGGLILREMTTNEDRPRQTVEEINNDFVTDQIHWGDLLFNIYFYSELSDLFHDQHNWYFGRFWKQIKKLKEQNRLDQQAFDSMWWLNSDLKHTFMPHQIFLDFSAKHFKSLSVDQAQDYQFTKDSFLFFMLKPKN